MMTRDDRCTMQVFTWLLRYGGLLTLVACASSPSDHSSGSMGHESETLSMMPPASTSLMRKTIVKMALEEWHYFGQQLLTYPNGEESMPHVGYWEDEDPYAARVGAYWQVTGMPWVNGVDCHQPWSAAFISYIMQASGVSPVDFPPSEAHWRYLKYIVQHSADPAARLLPHDASEYVPEPGDLICATRGELAAPVVTHPDDADALMNYKLHCDLVIRREGARLDAIGGNVRNSVSLSRLPLDSQGHLKPLPRRPWFLVIENRL